MELLRERLVECGWRDEMKALCRAYARKKGRSNVTVDDLIHVITPKGREGFSPVKQHKDQGSSSASSRLRLHYEQKPASNSAQCTMPSLCDSSLL
uniref:Transcription and mRNA export factor ENY2 n=1 Tax=Leersia perrieri TaxID=77586 RepID=A0A0D9V9L4_9ORYZ